VRDQNVQKFLAGSLFDGPAFLALGDIMSSDPAVVADEVRAQVTEVALICNRILATIGSFAHPHAIRNDLMSAIIALELAELQLSRMLFP
jgi:hypothetical protein